MERRFEEVYRSLALEPLEGRVDLGSTIRDLTYRVFGMGGDRENPISARIETFALLSAGLPRISIDVSPEVAGAWADPWILAATVREGVAPDEPGPDLSVATLLGEGGMGQVALAEQRSLRREVALKCLKPEESRPAAVEGLIHEGRILGSLAHPNVVPIHALGVDDTMRPVLILKRVEGVPWADLIRDPGHAHWTAAGEADAPPLVRNLEVLIDVCNAIAFAHSRGIVHRDLKPENVMVGAYGEVYVLDWGVAATLDDLRRIAAAPGAFRLVGTPRYMAPEMLEEDGAVGERTDVYLLGAMLHEVLTGDPPHHGETMQEVLLAAYLSAPAEYPPGTPEPLAELCRRAMERDPALRIGSAAEFREDLRTFLRHRGSLELTAAADERRRELDALATGSKPDHARASRAFAECQFGYLQALQGWPENPRARDGLERTLAAMCAVEIDHGQTRRAEALFARITAPSPALTARLEASRRELERIEQATRSYARLRRDLDFEAERGPRIRFFGVLTAIFLVLLVGHILPSSRVDRPHDYDFAVRTDAIILAIFAGVLVWQRRRLLATRIHRSFFGLFLLALAFKFLQRLVSWRLGVDLVASMALDLLALGVFCLIGGLTIRPWLHWPALICGLSLLAILAWPAASQPIYAAGNAGTFFFVAGHLVAQFLRSTSGRGPGVASGS